jgi:hypothetical protein
MQEVGQCPNFSPSGLAARELGKCVETLRAWDRNGRLPAIRIGSGLRVYTRVVIERAATTKMDGAEKRGD